MADPLRTDDSRAIDLAPGPDRDAKIEQLLLVGLDHYFAGDYHAAVNVWTRALFFDRTHAKARAYIERARSAMAEQQRESEELIHRGVAAFDRGEADQARRLLKDALDRGAASDDVQNVLDRLDRLEPGVVRDRPVRDGRAAHAANRVIAQDSDGDTLQTEAIGRLLPRLMWLAVGALGIAALFAAGRRIDWPGRTTPTETLIPAAAPDAKASTLPMPRRGEIALNRARAYVAGGHLHEALVALEDVKPTDPEKPEADQLKARLQRELIALTSLGHSAAAPPQPATDRRPQ